MHMDMQNTYACPYRVCRVDWAQPYARNVWVTRATGKWMSATMEPEKRQPGSTRHMMVDPLASRWRSVAAPLPARCAGSCGINWVLESF
jgi:hypothetical protein